jgi:aerobic carbon-monoxide dehydrogenase large subunit
LGSILGNRVARLEDPRFLTVGGTYVEDVVLPDAAWLTYVRSSLAHARIIGIDVSEAKTAPGVLAVLTGDDLAELGLAPSSGADFPEAMRRPFVARGVVRFVGEAVVAIIAEDRARGSDAADLVLVDYEPLPVMVDPEVALRDERLLYPDVGTNVVQRVASSSRADFAGCEVVVEERIVNQRLTAAPIEPRSAAAYWTDDGRLVHYAACQGAHPARDLLATVYGLDRSRWSCPMWAAGSAQSPATFPTRWRSASTPRWPVARSAGPSHAPRT